MAFKKLDKNRWPPRQWALVGHPGSGKSTFAAQMRAPILPIDADHRFLEVAHRAEGDILDLSDNPADHCSPERIRDLLRSGMPGAGVATIVVDSLTSIITPLVVEAILDNEAGRNKNQVAAFRDKALAMRTLQDSITGWGCDTLWIYHLRSGLDSKALERETTSISTVELARLRRSLNMQIGLVEANGRRSATVIWARRGRSGITLYDDTGCWRGMPEKIEQAVYGGLTPAQMDQLEKQAPACFANPAEAVAWGFEQGCFDDAVHAKNAYAALRTERRPGSAAEMRDLWVEDVQARLVERAQVVAK